jgi:hypothetical protein
VNPFRFEPMLAEEAGELLDAKENYYEYERDDAHNTPSLS